MSLLFVISALKTIYHKILLNLCFVKINDSDADSVSFTQ